MEAITVYGRITCKDTTRSLTLLNTRGVKFNWVDVEQSAEGRRIAESKNKGKLNTPTIVFGDESVLLEPSDEQLERKLSEKH